MDYPKARVLPFRRMSTDQETDAPAHTVRGYSYTVRARPSPPEMLLSAVRIDEDFAGLSGFEARHRA